MLRTVMMTVVTLRMGRSVLSPSITKVSLATKSSLFLLFSTTQRPLVLSSTIVIFTWVFKQLIQFGFVVLLAISTVLSLTIFSIPLLDNRVKGSTGTSEGIKELFSSKKGAGLNVIILVWTSDWSISFLGKYNPVVSECFNHWSDHYSKNIDHPSWLSTLSMRFCILILGCSSRILYFLKGSILVPAICRGLPPSLSCKRISCSYFTFSFLLPLYIKNS